MPRTSEERAADEGMRDAVLARMGVEGSQVDGVLVEFMVIIYVVSVDEDGDDTGRYDVLFSESSIPQHHAVGLLRHAENLLYNGEREG